MVAPAHVERGIGRHGLPGLGHFGLADIDEARQNQRLRAGAAFNQPAIDQQLVDTHLGRRLGAGCPFRGAIGRRSG
jgi:hypothetical protein